MTMTRRQLVGFSIAAAGAAGGLAWLTSRRPADVIIPPDTSRIEQGWLRTDPALLRWRERAPMPIRLQNPASFVIRPDGSLLVAGDCCLHLLNADGSEQRRITCQAPPRDVALLGDGTALIAFADRLAHLNAEGVMQPWVTLPPGAQASGLAASAAGVWVADSAQRRVWCYDPAARQCGVIGDRCEFIVPSAILAVVAAPDGTVWVSNPGRHRLEQFAADTSPLKSWGKAGGAIDAFFGCCNPARIALFPDGRFVTAEKGLPRVKVYSRDGVLASVVAGVECFVQGQKGLVPRVDATGRVLVLDPVKRAIRVFAPLEPA